MATGTIETEPGPRADPPFPVSLAWMPRKLTASASDSLDVIRAIAAFAVMFGHLRTLFFVDFQHLQSKSLPLQALYFFAGFGHQAVIVFFVLSGFLISSTVIRSHVLGKWSWRDYAVNRATRLYVVLVPGLLLGFFWDRLGSWLFAAKGIYTHTLSDLGTTVPLKNLALGTLFGNLLFLQTILCETFGSNGPLWSLANEFWYYVLFPVALAAAVAWRVNSRYRAVLLTALAIFLAIFLGPEILVGFLIWLAGAVLVLAFSNCGFLEKRRLILYFLVSSLVLSACLGAARTGYSVVLGSDLGVGIAFGLFLFGVLQ